MGDVVKVGWSGGKDSTCSVLLHLERGDFVKAVCYVPMFTDDIPLITKKHYDFILKTADRLKKMGATVHIISGMTYWDYVTKVATKGKFKGEIFGFPCHQTGKCGFQRDSKTKSVTNYDVGEYDYTDIGIAIDEPKRHSQLNDKKRSILCEFGYTEQMAFEKCKSVGMLSPLYERRRRDGCALCYNASEKERNEWFSDYPEAVPLLLRLQNIVKEKRPDRAPLRGGKYFIDTEQISIFD